MAMLGDGEIIPDTDDAIGICNGLNHLRNTLANQLGEIVDELVELQLTIARGQHTQTSAPLLALPSGKAINLARVTHVLPGTHHEYPRDEDGRIIKGEDGEMHSLPQPMLTLMFGSTSYALHDARDISAARHALGLTANQGTHE